MSTRTYFHEYVVLTIEANYKWVKQDILTLVASEIERIKNDPNLKGLIKGVFILENVEFWVPEISETF